MMACQLTFPFFHWQGPHPSYDETMTENSSKAWVGNPCMNLEVRTNTNKRKGEARKQEYTSM